MPMLKSILSKTIKPQENPEDWIGKLDWILKDCPDIFDLSYSIQKLIRQLSKDQIKKIVKMVEKRKYKVWNGTGEMQPGQTIDGSALYVNQALDDIINLLR